MFVRAAVPRIEGQSLLIMPHRRIELPQTAIGVAEVVLDIGIAGVAKAGGRERLDRPFPVAGPDRSLACREIRIERRPIRRFRIAAMVEQIGQASAAALLDTALPARADVAARSCRGGAVKKYDAGTAANTPTRRRLGSNAS